MLRLPSCSLSSPHIAPTGRAPSDMRSVNSGSSSRPTYSRSTVLANAPSLCAAERRTMGVSSLHRFAYSWRSSVFMAAVVRGYAVAKSPVDDTREVNHSPVARRCMIGRCASGAEQDVGYERMAATSGSFGSPRS
eukprot:364539-Chlamydomonas_euryale.AAC.9